MTQLAARPLTASDLERRLLYRDGLVLVLDKPAGLPVHAGPKGGPNLEDQLDALTFGLPRRPHLAHRLDRDTSGCLVLGRHAKALRRLGAIFAEGRAEKTYWAITVGGPAEPTGTIDLPLAKRSEVRGWWMKVDPAGQTARTDYRVLGRGRWQGIEIAWLELRPRTGRTHQIRVHTLAIGCPVLGDPIYGKELQPAAPPPMQLHAAAISLPLYPAKPPIEVRAEPPEHMLGPLRACGWEMPTG